MMGEGWVGSERGASGIQEIRGWEVYGGERDEGAGSGIPKVQVKAT